MGVEVCGLSMVKWCLSNIWQGLYSRTNTKRHMCSAKIGVICAQNMSTNLGSILLLHPTHYCLSYTQAPKLAKKLLVWCGLMEMRGPHVVATSLSTPSTYLWVVYGKACREVYSQEHDGANSRKWKFLHPFKGMFQNYILTLNFVTKP